MVDPATFPTMPPKISFGIDVYLGTGTVTIKQPFPEFDPDFDRRECEKLANRMGIPLGEFTVTALSMPMPVSMPVSIPFTILHDRLDPFPWHPGFNPESEQARGLVAAFPVWD